MFKHRLKNGLIKDVEVYSYPVTKKDGQQVLFSIINDISDRPKVRQNNGKIN